MNNYIVRSYRDVIVITKFAITKFAIRKASKLSKCPRLSSKSMNSNSNSNSNSKYFIIASPLLH